MRELIGLVVASVVTSLLASGCTNDAVKACEDWCESFSHCSGASSADECYDDSCESLEDEDDGSCVDATVDYYGCMEDLGCSIPDPNPCLDRLDRCHNSE